ncbi:type II secretion system protein GspF [Alginatibacterium sediminis]|uniref:Type II secretion system protein GspF n=1 Tax=Alginatibacterium sediminis TaxID=2164068 RepID=A0A420E656_9ALTE|nr:type II secretion system inner membrane protein GspF [Alginatibacterium sediminis]RKF13196.1 type II secretion system protein GspF [Alginatibacterium sediminis]
MPAFEYQAIDAKGKTCKGVFEADTPRLLRSHLREQGLQIFDYKLVNQQSKHKLKGGSKTTVSAADLALITRQLATLISAGLPIEESIEAVSQQCEKPKLQAVIVAVRSKVLEGHSLAESMQEFPRVFNHLYCAMVAAGEKSGHLDGVLERLADYTEQRQALRLKTLQATIYPAVLTLVSIAVVVLLLVSVVPKVVSQFVNMGQQLPWTTQLLINTSEFIASYGIVLFIVVVFVQQLVKRLLLNPPLRLAWDKRVLFLPVIGRVSRQLNTARYARTLSILNSSSVPLLESMAISAQVLGNMHMRSLLLTAAEQVREGSGLYQVLDATHLFPPMMLHMVSSGERSGELGQMLHRAADNQDQQFEAQVSIALGVFEPALIVSMAGIVLFIVMAILQPILELNNLMGM